MGISPRRLYGWEPREFSQFQYDADGRLDRIVTVREPEWTSEQRAWLLASHEIDIDTGSYGERLSEATDRKASPYYHGEDAIRFEAVGPTVNQAARVVEEAQKAREKSYPDASTAGHMWGVKKL